MFLLVKELNLSELDSLQQFPFQLEFYISQQETRTGGNCIGFHFYSWLYLNFKILFQMIKFSLVGGGLCHPDIAGRM